MKTENNGSQKSEYEISHEAMKAWNEQRARNEEKGVKKFHALKQQFADLKNRQTKPL